jgi:alpha-L-fucosidase
MQRFGDGRDRFFENRFGMFVHWGLYAIPAVQEQILWRYRYPRVDYEKLVGEFNPKRFEPERWLDVLQGAGMTYLCFTTKHHDGFCMWDTAETDYKVTRTPYRRDILAELAKACEKRGVLLSLYYSLPDWHHPRYPNLGRHHEMFGPRSSDRPDREAYLDYVRRQVRELLTGYGEIYQLFWDLNVAEFRDQSLNDMVRELQPGILINDRGPGRADYGTPERHVPEAMVFDSPTEACQAMGRESWGYREGESYYSNAFLMSSIDKILAMGGNYLLNVGPKADGTLPEENVESLGRIGDWHGRVREAFDGTIPCSYMLQKAETKHFRYDRVFLTRRDNVFYVHCPDPLQTTDVVLPGFETEPKSAALLNDGTGLRAVVDTIPWRWQERPCLRLTGLPVNRITDEPLVAKIEFDESVVR